jgi:hypothetical protein
MGTKPTLASVADQPVGAVELPRGSAASELARIPIACPSHLSPAWITSLAASWRVVAAPNPVGPSWTTDVASCLW